MEWDEGITPDKPIRQGDLLVLRSKSPDREDEYYLVITADCDIARNKHGNAYAAISVLTSERFIKEEWARQHLELCQKNELEGLINSFNKLARRTITKSAISAWVRRASSEQIAVELKITDPKERKRLSEVCPQIVALTPDASGFDTMHFERLLQYVSAKEVCVREEAFTRLSDIARKKLQSLSSDIFLLTEVPDDYHSDSSPGFALLRDLFAIRINEVTTHASDARINGKYLRIGRLKPTYKYALTQQFGTLYARIGLPDAYDARKAEILKQLTIKHYD